MKLSSPILAFTIASIGVHSGLVMTSNNTDNITLPSSEGSVIAVKMTKHQDYTKEKRKPTTKSLTKTKTKPEIKKVATQSRNIEKVQTNEQSEKSAQAEYQHAESKARVISVIHKELNQHFTYPKLAQRRNWQGKVLLSLRVTSSGKINNIRINQSSGYSILDQAAINSLIKMGNLPQISSWLPYEVNLKLPVIYQLTEG